MRYTLLLHYPEMTAEDLGPEALAEGQQAFTSYAATLQSAGVLLGAEVLQPSSSTTTLRGVDGSVQVQDGPFADTKDQLGGTFVIDVPDLDAAIEWAKRAPSMDYGAGAVEVRPGAVYTVDGVWTPNA
ncbi:YciI family protein [Agromyces salentinus]|uniref:YciI family protein n=1 Tax=Agromyces salentinus TaxID=269421 RepID=A0ABN2ML06_9MICO|nr:YciI family protein [Agromyces salentinus]